VATTTVVAFLACAPAARAQFNSVGPPFAKLTGGYLWGSLGYRDIEHPERFYIHDNNPLVRGGFAILFGPFGGQPDTTVALDSVRIAVEWMPGPPSTPGAMHIDTMRTVRAVRSHHTLPGRDGWLSLAVGYLYSGGYEVNLHDERGTLSSTFPVGGFYANAMFGPFPVWHVSRFFFWYATLGAGVLEVKGANGSSDSTLVRFDSESALAPEACLLLGWRAHRGVRVIGGISAQHIRWSALHFTSPSDQPLSEEVLRQLPESLRLTSVHVNLGIGFDVSDLFGR